MTLNVLFIDNFDSFTYNLVDEFAKRGCKVLVYRNNTQLKELERIAEEKKIGLIVVSPGPASPAEAGSSVPAIKAFLGKIPIFGVCLGHQCAIEAFGGKVEKAPETIHGKPSKIFHDGKTIYEGLQNPFSAGRYHSLCGTHIPDCIEVSAKTDTGIVMGIRHKKHFLEGVQFHPESILTPSGGKIIENIIQMAGSNKRQSGRKRDEK